MFNISSFLIYALVTAFTPGPNNLMSMSRAGKVGFRRTLPLNLGMLTGFAIIITACTFFCSTFTSLIPKIKTPMLVVGAAYILYLAWKTFRSTGELEENSSGKGYLSGLVLQFINPKLYLYAIVSMEAYVLPFYSDEPLILLGFSMFLSVLALLSNFCWALFGTVFKLVFSKYARLTNTVMALLLVYCAVSLFFN